MLRCRGQVEVFRPRSQLKAVRRPYQISVLAKHTYLQLLHLSAQRLPRTCVTQTMVLRCSDWDNSCSRAAHFGQAAASGGGFNIAEALTVYSLAGIYKSLKAMGMDPDAEFTTALMEGASLNARLICGNQEQSVTVKNIAKLLSIMCGVQSHMRPGA
ncbi:hypothetical protein ABBQ32_006635 [Trebouxia sp. C0010 RCD-2024]